MCLYRSCTQRCVVCVFVQVLYTEVCGLCVCTGPVHRGVWFVCLHRSCTQRCVVCVFVQVLYTEVSGKSKVVELVQYLQEKVQEALKVKASSETSS